MTARTRFGLTWWGQRWIAALEALGAVWENRLPRGRTYARKGTVTDLVVSPGVVTARVQGSRRHPYRVRIELPAFDDPTWQRVVTALARQLRHAAALLDGRMPEDVDEVLAGCGVSLFPRPGELATHCSCPDVANPCKHVAAVHYLLAQAFDADPFLLPALRGRDRPGLLAALRAERAGTAVAPTLASGGTDGGVTMAELDAATLWAARGDLAAIAVRPAPATDPGALLRRLGPMPAPVGAGPVDDVLEDAVNRAAHLAWGLAAGDSDH